MRKKDNDEVELDLQEEAIAFVKFAKLVVNKRDQGIYRYYKKKGIHKKLDDIQLKKLVDKYLNSGQSNLFWSSFSFKTLVEFVKVKAKYLEDMDENRSYIPMENGIFDLENRQLLPFSKKFHYSEKLKFPYDETAECPRFVEYLEEISQGDKDMQQDLTALIGLVICGDNQHHKFPFLYGEGSNGKSIYLNLLRKVVPVKYITSLSVKDINSQRAFSRHNLSISRLNIIDEFPANLSFDTLFDQNVKAIVTSVENETMLTAEVKFGEIYEFNPKCTLLGAGNDLPQITRYPSNAIMRRYIAFPFKRVFSQEEQDITLNQKLEKELPGIFNMALSAADKLRANNYNFAYQKKSDAGICQQIAEKYPYIAFVNDCVEAKEGEEVANSELLATFRKWAEKNDIVVVSSDNVSSFKIAKAITDKFPKVENFAKHEKVRWKRNIAIKREWKA